MKIIQTYKLLTFCSRTTGTYSIFCIIEENSMSYPTRLWRAVLTAALVLSTAVAPAVTLSQIETQIDNIIAGSSSSVQWSVLIENEWNTQTYYSLNPTTQRRPASNTKIFTTAAAFEIYGPTHVWNGFQLGSSSNSSPVHSILTSSNNSLADSLFSHNGGQTASKNALSAAGINMSGSVMLDGSGLSWNNRFNCRQTLDTVRYMMNTYSFSQWGTHLAVGCASGTLGSRFCGTVGSQNVFAKTGTLTNGQTLSLSGYIDNPNDGERYYFSIYCNSVPSQFQSGTRSRIDQIVNVMGQSQIPNPGPPSSVTPDIIIDNGSSGFTASSNWFTSTQVSGYYGANYQARATASASDAAAWNANLTAGDHEVFARWTSGSSRASNAAYIVTHTGGSTTVNVDQTQNNGQWVSLGTFNFAAGNSVRVQLSCWTSSGSYVIADAVGFTKEVTEIVIDNTDSGFGASSNWLASTSQSGYLGSNYQYRLTASTSDTATWTATIPTTASYEVFARWTTGSNRATAAPYIVYHTGGSTVVNKNQQSQNGTWVSLGTYTLAAGTAARVGLSCWTSSGTVVIADGVRLVEQ
jgi:hypothetical protein